jgi:SAM-dependent methyltransferase
VSDITAAQGGSELLTGERTVPGVTEENYWFRRHEVAYLQVASHCAGSVVLESGCGEGYGAAHLARTAAKVIALDYDHATMRYVGHHYPGVRPILGNLATLPLGRSTVDVVVNLQVIEHLWDQLGFLTECHRVLRQNGKLIISTPNRLTFSPGYDTPLNPFHTRELDPSELDSLLTKAGFRVTETLGLRHGPRLRELDTRHGGSLIQAQLDALLGTMPGEGSFPPDLHADVASIQTADFDLTPESLDTSLDLLAVAVRG